MEVLNLYMFNPFLERPEHITPGLLGYMYTQTDRQKHTHTNTHKQTHIQVCVCVTHVCIRGKERKERKYVCVSHTSVLETTHKCVRDKRREREGLCVHMYSREHACRYSCMLGPGQPLNKRLGRSLRVKSLELHV